MEGLPSKYWQLLQRQYLHEEGKRKSSRRWIRGLLIKLHQLNHQQWKHWCKTKAHITQPALHKQEDMLNKVISKKMAHGAAELDPGDQSILDQNIIQLLWKLVPYKKARVTRILAAQQWAH
jgi:hypothetical protein